MSRAYLSWARLEIPQLPDTKILMSGAAAAASSGAIFNGASLVGQQLQSAQNVFLGGTGRAYLSWARFEAPASVVTNVAQTGQSATSAAGTFPYAGATRAYLSWAQFEIPISGSLSVTLTGQSGTSAAGALTFVGGTQQVLTGQSATSNAGILAWPLNGSLMTASVGSVSYQDDTFAFAGQMTPSDTATVVGNWATGFVGNIGLIVNGAVVVTPVGAQAVSAVGTSIPGNSSPLTGAQGFFGTPGVFNLGAPIVLTGGVLTSSVGVITPLNPTTGTEASGVSGAMGVATSIALTGIPMNGTAGNFSSALWTEVAPGGGSWTSVARPSGTWTQ